MITDYFDENFDFSSFIPTAEEIDYIIKKIENDKDLSFQDIINIEKLKWINRINRLNKEKDTKN